MTRFAAPLAVLLTVGLGALSTTGCELIAQVDRSKIAEPTGAGGAGGTVPTGPSGSGGMTGTGGAGGAGGMTTSCTTPDDCPGTDTVCQTRTCDNGFCGVDYAPAGTATQNQMVGDCQMEICDGQGNITLANDDQDILDDQNPCTQDLCSAGSPVNAPAPGGTTCSQGTGTMCDGNGACVECLFPSECPSGVCQFNTCIPASCTDGLKNDTETDVDCGGPSCSPCADGLVCDLSSDCQSGVCTGNLCQVPTCSDSSKNGAETDVDCGGGTCNPCSSGKGCTMDSDCIGQLCSGSLCLATCSDGEKNANETDIDCGGPTCSPCNGGKVCAVGGDCVSGVCSAGVCQAPSCTDMVKNGSETDVDCGGTCPPCGPNQVCTLPSECTSGICNNGVCATPTCGDGVTNGTEACDDGGTMPGDGCDTNCGLEPGYTCTGSPSVCTSGCGNGVVAPGEDCDDGGLVGGDGCDANCGLEPGYTCSGMPSACIGICGDGMLVPGEACDDGGMVGGDGCDANCVIELGYGCSGAPSICAPICGDGIVLGGEECDDNNATSGDCCSSACLLEAGCEIEPNNTVALANNFDTLAVGGQIRASIKPLGETDYFSFTTTQIVDLRVETFDGTGAPNCASGAGQDTKVWLYASNGTTLLGLDDDDGPNACSDLNATNDAGVRGLLPGTYYIRVEHAGGSFTINNYILRISTTAVCGNGITEGSEQCDGGASCNPNCTFLSVCGDGIKSAAEACDDGNLTAGDGCSPSCTLEYKLESEPNNTCAAANGPFALSQGVPVRLASGSVTPAGDLDWFAFTIPAYADLRFETFDWKGPGTCASIDTVIQAFKSDCTQLGASKDQGGISNCSKIDPSVDTYVRHLAPGTYYLQVKAYSSSATFDYTLQATMTAICGNGIKEGSEQCDGGAFCNPDCTIIPVCGNGVKEGSEECDDGNLTAGDTCSPTCMREITAEVEPNNTRAEADAAGLLIDSSKYITAAVNPDGDVDLFKVQVATGQAVRFEVFDPSGVDCVGMSTMTLRLLDSMGVELKKDMPGSDASGISVCPALVVYLDPGTYYLESKKSTAGTIAGYFLEARFLADLGSESEVNDTQAAANTLTGPDLFIYGDHQTPTDLDWYAITVPQGASIRAETIEGDGSETCESNGIDTTVTMYNAAGTSMGSDGDDGRGWCSTIDGTGATPRDSFAHNLTAGTYYLQVKSFSTSTSNGNMFNYRLAVTVR